MALSSGTRLGPYEILAPIGAGGMGEVYKARDTTLNRDVAIKVLPEVLARDSARMERFHREAQVLAQLNHPNICTLYGVEKSDGVYALVMELVEGPTLAGRLSSGAIPLEEALPIARQMAEALEAAHEKGIIHRDLKPANVKIRPDGAVKVLDFGLAKALEGDAAAVDPVNSPTLTLAATQAGVIMGTAAYMSPEQARGETVDKRSDIWSFGVVLYEMLTGRQLFGGKTVSDSLAGVLKTEIDFTLLGPETPPTVQRLLRRCLERDSKHRLRDIGEARIAIEEQLADPAGASVLMEAPSISVEPRRERLPWALLAATVCFALGIAFLHFRQAPPESLVRFAIAPPVPLETHRVRSGAAISPNGKHIAYTAAGAEGKLWVQDLDQSQPRAIEDTEGPLLPFWSPDSEFIGFATGGELRKVSVTGGLATRLCALPVALFTGGTWSPGGESIVFGSGNYEIFEVPARGGTARLLISPKDAEPSSGEPFGILARPHFLPSEAGDRVLVYTYGVAANNRQMMVEDLDSGRRETLGPGTHPFYSSTGHLVYQAALDTHDLWALPFSLGSLQPTGEAFPVTQGGRGPTIAMDQTLVYVEGFTSEERLVELDREGQGRELISGGQIVIDETSLSPSGRFLAFVAVGGSEGVDQDVWVLDIERGVKTRLTTTDGFDRRPVWSPDGTELAFSSVRSGNFDIWLRRADGSGEAEALSTDRNPEYVTDWSHDGRHILYTRVDPDTGYDLWYLERKEDGGAWEPRPFLQTPFREGGARLSPDGRFVVYVSDESGQSEIYVRPFPEGGGRVTVSRNGGTQAVWSGKGDEIFYIELNTLMAVSVSTSPGFSVGAVTRLFANPALVDSGSIPDYDVSADGERFYLAEPVEGESAAPSIRVVQNWFAEFRDRR